MGLFETLTWEESELTLDWLVVALEDAKLEMIDLDVSASFVEWLLDGDAFWVVPFFTRLAPAVVETFHTSYTSQTNISKMKIASSHSLRRSVSSEWLHKPAAFVSLVLLQEINTATSVCTWLQSNVSLKGKSPPKHRAEFVTQEQYNLCRSPTLLRITRRHLVKLIFQTTNLIMNILGNAV